MLATTSIPLAIIGVAFLVLALPYLALKASVAHSHCEGGAPLLDAVIFAPMFLSIGGWAALRGLDGPHVSMWILFIAALLIVVLVLTVAWHLGKHSNQ